MGKPAGHRTCLASGRGGLVCAGYQSYTAYSYQYWCCNIEQASSCPSTRASYCTVLPGYPFEGTTKVPNVKRTNINRVRSGLTSPVEVNRAPLEAVVCTGTGWAARALVPHCVVHQSAKHDSLTHEDSGSRFHRMKAVNPTSTKYISFVLSLPLDS
ncbi:hypothetical protein BBK36DRAFT_1141200 [Trichoderma citrinoviride]|uniref:Uncharacterized protein n=1 Tax=Trichoderma citrinoviride TaxID=58853 RepID=A0A2T4BAJ4_9HYPO|nr:hypothetical protein BBK36DRAFT_1141200 [Trichoderma citrinoviride]PTB66345.1 hypothetical protein BBK36DRAFT_1141200 [Trichoderma citrinoviride]